MAKFIVSHRLANRGLDINRVESRAAFEKSSPKFAAFAQVHATRSPKEETARGMMLAEGDPKDFEAKRKEAPADLIIEAQVPRRPCLFAPRLAAAGVPAELGLGASLNLTVRSGGSAVGGASVTLLAVNLRLGSTSSWLGITDRSGTVSIPYDPRMWLPTAAIIVPKSGIWSWLLNRPQDGLILDLPPLPKSGPIGWWHQILGITKYSERRGEGIRVGVVDTGVGPNSAVAHVRRMGALVNGALTKAKDAGADVAEHGTHVAGIIGARPDGSSGNFAGIAPGADLMAIRVYPGGAPPPQPEGTASNGDIAAAIDQLSGPEAADLINLSLGGDAPSDIELDAVLAAAQAGSLAICSAGNQNGAPIMYPAAYPQTVSVSAVGLMGAVPNGSLDSLGVPSAPDQMTYSGLYFASFSNAGPEMKCTAPGVGIISTVPGHEGSPYAAMSGTSMAAPAVCGALATLLSEDAVYRRMPRGLERTQRAWSALFSSLRSLNLQQIYQGYGLVTAWPT